MTTGIEVSVARAAAKALPLAHRTLMGRLNNQRIAAESLALSLPDSAANVIKGMSSVERARFEDFVESQQFGQLMLQAIVQAAPGSRWEEGLLRDQVRSSLRLHGRFSHKTLYMATDALVGLVNEAVHLTTSAAPGIFNSSHSIASASMVATAAARNSKLLDQTRSLIAYDDFATALRLQVVALHSQLQLPSMLNRESAEYSRLYVEPRVAMRDDEQPLSLSELIAQELRFAVVGDPGAGKSTLANKLAHDIAIDDIPGQKGCVPLLLTVRQYASSIVSEHNTLGHYLELSCKRPFGLEPPSGVLDYLLLNGRAVVIIDGIDELGQTSFRQSFITMVHAFTRRYPLTRIIATSRVVGYDSAPLDKEKFPLVQITPFDEERVFKYADLWFRLDKGLSEQEHNALLLAFMRESREASDLRANPLLLSLLCVLYSTVHFIPRNRPEIYQKCAETLFETWDRTRGINVPFRYAALVRPAVQQIAWHLLAETHGRQALPRSEMATFLTDRVFGKQFENRIEAHVVAESFLDFCADRAWVFTDMGASAWEPTYGFTHRTFLEFFSAAQLVKQKPDAETVWQKIEPHLYDGSWHVVGQIAVQILDRDLEDGADQLLNLLIDRVELAGQAIDSGATELLLFACLSLDNVVPNASTLRRLASLTLTRSCMVPATERRIIRDDREDRLAWTDRPLATLLGTRSPELSSQLAAVIADVAHSLAATLPVGSSAGLIYALLEEPPEIMDVETPIFPLLETYMAGRTMPQAAAYWSRIINRPSPDDIRAHGTRILYEATIFYDERVTSWVYDLSRCVIPDVEASDVAFANDLLSELYPEIIRTSLADISRDAIATCDLQSVPIDIHVDGLLALDQRARAALLLLLLPLFTRPFVQKITDKQFALVADVHHHAYRRPEAKELIMKWGLPEEAQSRIFAWMDQTNV